MEVREKIVITIIENECWTWQIPFTKDDVPFLDINREFMNI